MKENKEKRVSIGGQAVMEGIMMRGKTAMVTAVRDPEHKIQIESERLTPPEKQRKFFRLPFVRGVVNFVHSLIDGNRVLLRSADVAFPEDEEQQSKAGKLVEQKFHVNLGDMVGFISVLLGVVLAVLLFIWLPQTLAGLFPFDKTSTGLESVWFNLIEGGLRLLVFVGYILIISLIPSLKRVFMCHGAEHKTISCYEQGKELTIENVRTCSRVHDRCGTTFLFLVMIVSILVFSLANVFVAGWLYTGKAAVDNALRVLFKLLLLPVVAGVSYEILRLLAKTRGKFFLIFKWPGLLLQRLTTREPEDGMIECAIVAFTTVLKMDADPDYPTQSFALGGKMSVLLKKMKERFAKADIDGDDAEWIFALSLGIPKSAVSTTERLIKRAEAQGIFKIADERLTGRPLWYIIGDTDFCGYTIKVDERVLIPRPETEELAVMVANSLEDGFSVLDLCTGSGAIAIAIAKEAEKQGKQVKVTAVDISEAALALAKENAQANEADILFIQSDLFTRLRGRFDVIVSNPPYIPSQEIDTLQREVKSFEPRLALDGGADGLDIYRRIAQDAFKYLNRNGYIVMEVGKGQAQDVAKMFKGSAYSVIMKDFNDVERYVKIIT